MSSNESWHVYVDPSVYKTLARFPHKDAERISDVITKLADNPFSGDIIKLGGSDEMWRRRIGSYRIFYEVSVAGRWIDVSKVERRGSKTY